MKLLRIGRWYINFDLVRYVDVGDPEGMTIFFSGENREGEILQLGPEETAAMKEWLRLNSMEVMPPAKNWHPASAEWVDEGR